MTSMKQEIIGHVREAEQAINSITVEDCIWNKRKLRTEFLKVSDALHKLALTVEKRIKEPRANKQNKR
jgi:hypothetical protein